MESHEESKFTITFRKLNYNCNTITFGNDNYIYLGTNLTTITIKLINDAFEGIDPTKIVDVHAHLIGMNTEESGCYVHENLSNCCKCQSYAKKYLILQKYCRNF